MLGCQNGRRRGFVMASSTYLATAILQWLKGTPMPAAPSSLYLELHDGNPGMGGTGNSVQATVTGTANRTLIVQADLGAAIAIPGGGLECLNANAITVTASSVNTGLVLVSHASLWTAVTGGTHLQFDALAVPVEVRFGDLVRFDPSSFSISVL